MIRTIPRSGYIRPERGFALVFSGSSYNHQKDFGRCQCHIALLWLSQGHDMCPFRCSAGRPMLLQDRRISIRRPELLQCGFGRQRLQVRVGLDRYGMLPPRRSRIVMDMLTAISRTCECPPHNEMVDNLSDRIRACPLRPLSMCAAGSAAVPRQTTVLPEKVYILIFAMSCQAEGLDWRRGGSDRLLSSS